MRILVIEPEPGSCTCGELLRARGHTVRSARAEELAGGEPEGGPFAMVVLAHGAESTVTDGVERCRAIQRVFDRDAPFVLAAIETEREDDIAALLDAGADDAVLLGASLNVLAARFVVAERGALERARHRQAEVSLEQRVAHTAAVLNSAGDAVLVTDERGAVVRVNPVAEELTGWRAAEAHGRPLGEVFRVHDEWSDEPLEALVARMLNERAGVGRLRRATLLTRDGVSWPVSATVSPMRDDDGEGPLRGLVVVARDTTAERAAEEAFQRAHLDFQRVLEHCPDGLAISIDGLFIYGNASVVRSLGHRTRIELVGRNVADVIHPEDRAAWLARLADVRGGDGGAAQAPAECRLLRRDGEPVALEVQVVPLLHFDGADALLWVVRDVSERKRMQARMVFTDRMASLGTLAAGVAHEMNNPLSYVVGNLGFLAEELQELSARLPPARAQDLAETVRDAREGAERLRQIVQGLKAFSRAHEEPAVPVDVRAALEGALRLVRAEVRQRARLATEFGEVPTVRGNEGRLGQVFVNLLVNAAHAIPEGHAERNEVRVRTFTDAAGRAVVEVVDSGCGIGSDTLGRIFDPFFTTKPVGEGTGLGLSICHGIVTGMGGEIQVQSTPGQGSAFRVVLPPADGAEAQARGAVPSPARARGCGRRGRVLVIDDESGVGASVQRLLSREHEVRVATSGRAALDTVQRGERFDVVLCDLMLEGGGGMDLYAELSRLSPEQAERVVLFTAGAFTNDAQAFLDGFRGRRLDKPFAVDALRGLVRELVG